MTSKRLWDFGVSWSLGFVLGLPSRSGFWKYSKWPWNMIHLMPCRNPCRVYIHLAFTYFFSPSSILWSKIGLGLPSPSMRELEVQWSHVLSLVCEVALSGPEDAARWKPYFLYIIGMQVHITHFTGKERVLDHNNLALDPSALVAIITECIIPIFCFPFTIACHKLRRQFYLAT
jgi:hypothetical protein